MGASFEGVQTGDSGSHSVSRVTNREVSQFSQTTQTSHFTQLQGKGVQRGFWHYYGADAEAHNIIEILSKHLTITHVIPS